MRTSYGIGRLDLDALGDDPLDALTSWIHDAAEAGTIEPNAMALASADEVGRPSARMVLCKGVDARGVSFYTSLESRKGAELAAAHGRRRRSGGTASSGRFGSRGRCSAFRTTRRTPTSRRVRAAVASAPGRRSRVARSRTERRWNVVRRRSRHAFRVTPRCPGLRTGAASCSARPGSSSGRRAKTACTTGSGSRTCRTAGRASGSVPDERSFDRAWRRYLVSRLRRPRPPRAHRCPARRCPARPGRERPAARRRWRWAAARGR